MARIAVGFLVPLVLLPALQARDKPETQTPAQQYQALEKEYETAEREFRKALVKLKTNDERRKAIQEKNPQDQLAPRFLELAEKNPKDPAAVDALIWIASHSTTKLNPQSPRSKAIRLLLRDHLQSEKMTTLCQSQSLRHAQDEDRRHLMRAVLEKSKNRSAQGQACFALAQQAESRIRTAKLFKERPELAKNSEASAGKEAIDALLNADLEKLSQEAESYYERVVKEFADVADSDDGPLGEIAKDKLDTLRHPVIVGKPAPDIAGQDIDSKEFKLSDYRGKVVLLDFWGHW